VNQLLALARAESTGRNLPTVLIDLPGLVREVIEDSIPRALDKRIDLGYEGPDLAPSGCQLIGNPTLLRELVRNLVDNALHYTPGDGVVTARVLIDPFSGVQVLQVEDNGPGVPENERGLVLEPFYRALGTNVDGSGLGLAIVLEIAHQHGAQLQLEDTFAGRPTRRGLRVTVRFPQAEPGGE
jgi:two-component system, OmpR family, sensor histidine kinase TctE